jgi:hypothetical protein
MTTTVDTNVLVYASDTGAPEHERAQALLEHLVAGPDLVVLLWPTLLAAASKPSPSATRSTIATPPASLAADSSTDQRAHSSSRGESQVRGRPRPPGCMLICMQSTSVRIDATTHQELKRLAAELHTTVGATVTLAVRALRQDRVGSDLTAPLRDDEVAWLDADLG